MRDFIMKREISDKKTRDFRLNGGFPKRKGVIFANLGDLRRENACFSHKWGICKEKTHHFRINAGFSREKA